MLRLSRAAFALALAPSTRMAGAARRIVTVTRAGLEYVNRPLNGSGLQEIGSDAMVHILIRV